MKPAAFAYHAPRSLPDALALLRDLGDDGKVLAGGQSLVPAMNFRLARPGALVDINKLAELTFLRGVSRTGLVVGALSRHATFHVAPDDGPLGRLFARVVKDIAHYPIRQRGTFGGSLSHADPASEWCLLSLTAGATMVIESADRGEKRVPAQEFFRGTFTTAVEFDEILTRIEFPAYPDSWRGGFYEFSRRKGDFALAMSAALVRLDGGRIAEARIGVGSVADRPLRLAEVERALVGKAPDAAAFEAAGELAKTLVTPNGDIHGTPEYRRDLMGTVIKRALIEATA